MKWFGLRVTVGNFDNGRPNYEQNKKFGYPKKCLSLFIDDIMISHGFTMELFMHVPSAQYRRSKLYRRLCSEFKPLAKVSPRSVRVWNSDYIQGSGIGR